jgi:hypothetical protein
MHNLPAFISFNVAAVALILMIAIPGNPLNELTRGAIQTFVCEGACK